MKACEGGYSSLYEETHTQISRRASHLHDRSHYHRTTTLYPFRSTEKISVAVPMAVKLRNKVNPPAGWKRFDVNKQFTHDVEKMFSFYLPPDMHEYVRSSEFYLGQPPVRFINKDLDFGFSYRFIDRWENETLWDGKMSCESLAEERPGASLSRSSEVEIGGRRAIQAFWKLDNSTLDPMTVCFADIGDGTILQLWAGAGDERSLNIAKRIFGTIEFPNKALSNNSLDRSAK